MTEPDDDGYDRRRTNLELGLAKIEGKLDAIIASSAALTVTVNDLDRRVRDVETSMATVKQQLSEIERHEPPRANWVGVVSAAVAALTLGLFIAERLFAH